MSRKFLSVGVLAIALAGCAQLSPDSSLLEECATDEMTTTALSGDASDTTETAGNCGKHGTDEHLTPPPGQVK